MSQLSRRYVFLLLIALSACNGDTSPSAPIPADVAGNWEWMGSTVYFLY